jgi:A/G-specific adenine glycosylase
VATVVPYYHRFLERFPDPTALANAPLDEVLALWRGLGYYARARNLHRAAQAMTERHGGQLPSSLDALLALPGFGRYTAGAVASIAFGQRAPLVDGNVARVLSRLFAVEGLPGDRARETRLWELAEQLVDGAQPGALNQALMELGALICLPKSPACGRCPVRARCEAFRTNRVAQLPPPKVRAPKRKLVVVAGFWERSGRVLLGRRAAKGLFGGLWELPSVERSAETDAPLEAAFEALLGTKVRVGQPLATVRRILTHRELMIHVHALSGRGQPKAAGYAALTWAAPELDGLGISTAMRRAVDEAWATLHPR